MMKTAELVLTQDWDKTFPKRPQQGDIHQPLRHHSRGGYVCAEKRGGQAARYRCFWTLRCGQGAVLGIVRADNG